VVRRVPRLKTAFCQLAIWGSVILKIVEIREINVPLEANISNSLVSFAGHDVSLVAVISDVIRAGKPVTGLAFNSIGRFAQSGILRERLIPRVISADPEKLLDDDGLFDCNKIQRLAIRNEKLGGHGDRASAVAALELAFWDLNAKLANKPAYAMIARHFGITPLRRVPVYAAGGYYYNNDSLAALRDELSRYIDWGFNAFKIKIGGASLSQDMARIEASIEICGDGGRLAVDANGRFAYAEARAYAKAIQSLALRWFEEIGDPLDFDLNRKIIGGYPGPVATGENLFSSQDVKNLLNFGGMRPGYDIFQMDAGLSYGLTEYATMVAMLEDHGFDRKFMYPHGGHLINLHIVAGLNLGGCEAYPSVFQPFGGYSSECVIDNGFIAPTERPGFGLDAKAELQPLIEQLLA
jgi:L-alanine-DL-glutamate epimerase-like enolase superfamily enzyme